MTACDRCGAIDVKLSIDDKCARCSSYFARFTDHSGPVCIFCEQEFPGITEILDHARTEHHRKQP